MNSIAAEAANAGKKEGILGAKYGWRVVLFSMSGWFFDGYVINIWSLAIPFLLTDFHLTVQEIGTITTLYVIGYTLGTLFGGTLADYFGRRSVLSFAVLFYMFIGALTALAQGFWSLAIFRWLTGTGTGVELPVGSTFVMEAVHNKWRGRLISIMGDGNPLGYVLAVGAFATIGAAWGWRAVFVASIIPGIIVFIIRRKVSESSRFQAARGKLARGEVTRDKVANVTLFRKPYLRDTLPAALYWVGNAFAFWAAVTFLPLYLIKVRHLPVGTELIYMATWQLSFVVVGYLGGWLSDRWGRRPAAILFAILSFVLTWGLTFAPSGAPLYVVGWLYFGCQVAPWNIGFAHSAEIFPTHIRSTGVGTTLGCGRIVSILAPLFFGVVAARYGLAIALRLGALAWILTVIGFLLSRETSGIELEQIDNESLWPQPVPTLLPASSD